LCRGFVNVAAPGNRCRRRKEPRFVLHLCQYDANYAIRSRGPGSLQQRGTKFCRAIVVCVQQQQDAPVGSSHSSCQLDSPFQLSLLHDAVPVDAYRREDSNIGSRGDRLGDSAQQKPPCPGIPLPAS